MNQQAVMTGLRNVQRSGLGTPMLLLVILAMMVVPLPTFLLDILFTFNISLSLVVLMAVVYSKRPLELSAFPTVLLVATLMRLSLNIASTRVVLLHGHNGTEAAGQVIHAFGEFVIGGDYTVGFVVFAILIIINFVVITKGAGRISEVSARFTLDAMPGKQMAIDADLNAGIINQEEAKARRKEIAEEAEFYGSMDGASKFVRGDAVAGILILFINVIGGFAIGTLEHEMAVADAARVYTLLTIGDGLVAQIPALLLATGSAIMVARVSTAEDMSQQIIKQLFANPRTLGVAAGILGLLGVIPGMPNFVFLLLAGAAGAAAWYLAQEERKRAAVRAEPPPAPPKPETREIGWDDVTPVDLVGLEVGYRLIPMVDRAQGGQLLGRLKGVRKKLSQELGFLIPAVHIRDNLDLKPGAYRITLMGATVSQAEVLPDRELAINPGQVFGKLKGTPGRDPVFGLEAVWIEQTQRDHAQSLGYTVVDASTVVATHLSQLLQEHAHELLGHDETQQLLTRLQQSSPKLVEDLVPKVLPLGVVVKVLQNLLRESVPIRDIRTIVEELAEHAHRSQDPVVLTAAVRAAMGRAIVQQIIGLDDELPVITLDPSLEHLLHQSIRTLSEGSIPLEPGLANRLIQSIREAAERQEMQGQPAVLLVPDGLRDFMARFVRHGVKNIHVLAFAEVPENRQIKIVANVGRAE
ncbi:MAG: Flagellar biosynthesis protein FlhA [Gammaproteobacteria bacterium]|nr:Flagellar biosynthesis protein FlhA [Gammaproteobacteria bacterium]